MDNNNIGGMNPQQFSQNTPQTSQPHMGMSGIELQKMQQEAEQRRFQNLLCRLAKRHSPRSFQCLAARIKN